MLHVVDKNGIYCRHCGHTAASHDEVGCPRCDCNVAPMKDVAVDLSELQSICKQRTITVFKTDDWSLTDWGCALAGEAGEMCNILKKIRRGDFSLDSVRGELADELADILIYLCDIAAFADIELSAAVKSKFNRISDAKRCSLVI